MLCSDSEVTADGSAEAAETPMVILKSQNSNIFVI